MRSTVDIPFNDVDMHTVRLPTPHDAYLEL